ncbi:MAG: hypothetical protein WCI67_24250 [Chloroflexales bacterium]
MPTNHVHALAKRPETTARTYRLQPATVERLNLAAARLGVSVSDLADFLICAALGQVAAGALRVETQPAQLRSVKRG